MQFTIQAIAFTGGRPQHHFTTDASVTSSMLLLVWSQTAGCWCVPYFASQSTQLADLLQLNDENADIGMVVDGMQGCIGSLQALKKQHQRLKVLLSIGGGLSSTNFPAVAADPEKRNYFATSVKELIDGAGFDGVDSKLTLFLFNLMTTRTLFSTGLKSQVRSFRERQN